MRPEFYISHITLKGLLKHYERRARAKRGWAKAYQTDIVDDTLQALRELLELNYPKAVDGNHASDCRVWVGESCRCEVGKRAL